MIAHIIILSRRRPGEVVRATLENYSRVAGNDEIAAVKENILTEDEKRTCSELHVFHVPGKNTRKVPCLLTNQMKDTLDLLLESRQSVGVPEENKLLFPRCDCLNTYDGTKIIEDMRNKFQLKKPKHFTATGLRHHAATFSQLNGRDDTYTENLANFMGHDVNIHKSNYRLPLPLIQKSQVGHRLLQMTLPRDKNTQSESTIKISPSSSSRTNKSSSLSQTSAKCSKDSSICEEGDLSYEPSIHSSLSTEEENIKDSSVKKTKGITRVRWNEEEKNVINKYFGTLLLNNTYPERRDIKKMYEAENIFINRTLPQLCSYINNVANNKVKIPPAIKLQIRKGLI